MVVLGGTIAISFVEKIVVQTTLVKILADRGYRLEKFKFLKFSDILLLIPFINIIRGIRHFIDGYKILDLSEEQLSNDNRFVLFTEYEKEEYNNAKTTYNALRMNLKVQVIPNMFLSYVEGESVNEILFAKEGDRYVIIDTKGRISELSRKKQYMCLEEQMKEIEGHFSSNFTIPKEEQKPSESNAKTFENKLGMDILEKPKIFVKNREVIK